MEVPGVARNYTAHLFSLQAKYYFREVAETRVRTTMPQQPLCGIRAAGWQKGRLKFLYTRTWLRHHNHYVKQTGRGVRILACRLPSKSPWLNPIEPKWVHGKRAMVEPDRLLSAQEVMERVSAYDGCGADSHLAISEKAA